MLVYVLNKNNKPLMPCSPAKARHLLRDSKAKVIRAEPFTIQLLYGSSGYRQPITLGVDSGSQHVGMSATTEKEEAYASETELRNDITKNLSKKRQYRKSRRNRKTRHRKPRFDNRVHSKNKGWLAPSIENKIRTHEKLISDVCKILPIKTIIVETAAFDIQKIKNPDIQGKEYQEGEQLGFWNTREYVLFRDGHVCKNCNGESKDKVLEIHHIESRKTGGNAPNNLITLCSTCHKNYHARIIQLKDSIKRGASFRDAAFMGIMRWTLYNRLKKKYPDVRNTYGYITKHKRIEKQLPKEHSIDAFCIAGNMDAEISDTCYYQKQVRETNRQIYKAKTLKGGVRKKNQSPKYVKGYQLYDKVEYNNHTYFIFGRRNSGYFDIRTLSGEKVNNGSVSYKKLNLIEKRRNIITERRSRSLLMTKVTSLRTA